MMNIKRYGCALALALVTSLPATVFADTTPPDLSPRTPQFALNGTELQTYFTGIGEGINVYTDQLAAQVFVPSASGNSAMTLMIELAGFADQNELGVYNGKAVGAPTLYQVFPPAASTGWSAMVSFHLNGDIVVNLFDNTGAWQGTTLYPAVNVGNVGFYLKGPGGTFYSQDERNGNVPQALMYAGTGKNYGEFWVCWEDLPLNGSDMDFNDEIVLIQSLAPVPVTPATWGKIKAQYH